MEVVPGQAKDFAKTAELPNMAQRGTIEEERHTRKPQCWEAAWQKVLQTVGTQSSPCTWDSGKLQPKEANCPLQKLEPAGADDKLIPDIDAPFDVTPTAALSLKNTWVLQFHLEDDIEAYLEAFEGLAYSHRWPREEWVARLKPHLSGKALLACSISEHNLAQNYDLVKERILHRYGITVEVQRQGFRQFQYQEAQGPRETCAGLQAVGRRWLKPERHTKEQILELLFLEQFLAILPQEMQNWVRECNPETCNQAVDLAEGFQLRSQPPVPFKDICVEFTNGEWALLSEEQRGLYRDVMLENFRNVSAMGVPGKKPELIAQIEQGEQLCFQEDARDAPTGNAAMGEFTGNMLLPAFKEQQVEKSTAAERSEMGVKEKGKTRKRQDKWQCSGPLEVFDQEPSSLQDQPSELLKQGHIKMLLGTTQLTERQASTSKGKIPKRQKQTPPASKKKWSQSPLPGETSRSQESMIPTAKPCKKKKHPVLQDGPPKLKKQPVLLGEPPKLRKKNEAATEPPKLKKEPPLPNERTPSKNSQEKQQLLCFKVKSHEVTVPIITWHPPFSSSVVSDLTCLECGRTFKQRADLRRHRYVHTKEKPYACQLCEKRFGHPSNLHIHLRTHSGERPYQCLECGKAFTQSCNLRTHSQIHSGSKPYRCCVCGKSFRHSSNLTIHQRVHTGERPYACSSCPKRFGDRSTLVQHERTHTGERPYACHVCEQRFSQISHLLKHSRVHPGARGPPRPKPAGVLSLSPPKGCFLQPNATDSFRMKSTRQPQNPAWKSSSSSPSDAGPSQNCTTTY